MKFSGFQLGDVAFDPATRALTDTGGRAVQLRNKSKEVLTCLLAKPNQTVSKADILGSVWSDVTVSDESLVQCIADIRRVIGKDARYIVETVPRAGYRVNLPTQAVTSTSWAKTGVFAAAAVACVAAFIVWPQTDASTAQPEHITAELNATLAPETTNTDAYLEVLQGRVSANRFSHGESLTAERHFRRAIALDPNYARAYAELGTLLAVRFENDWTVLVAADQDKSLFYAEKAVALAPDLWLGHYALGRLQSVFANFEAAEAHLEKAMSLQPDNEDARAYLGIVKNFRGDVEGSIAILQPAVQSHPNPPYWYYFGLGHALYNAGRFDEAKEVLQRCLEVAENSPYCLRYMIAVHGATGNVPAAQNFGQIYAATGFDLSIESILKLMTFHHADDRRQLQQSLRLAGVPD